jgi:hypothetical protein
VAGAREREWGVCVKGIEVYCIYKN